MVFLMITASEFPFLKRRFSDIFGQDLQRYMDAKMLIVCRALMFDVVKFCDWLESKYPAECRADGTSYKDIVLAKFGKGGVELIEKLISE